MGTHNCGGLAEKTKTNYEGKSKSKGIFKNKTNVL
jgi:hypothetical protein